MCNCKVTNCDCKDGYTIEFPDIPFPQDGVGIIDITLNSNNELVFTLSNATTITSAPITLPPAPTPDIPDPLAFMLFNKSNIEGPFGVQGEDEGFTLPTSEWAEGEIIKIEGIMTVACGDSLEDVDTKFKIGDDVYYSLDTNLFNGENAFTYIHFNCTYTKDTVVQDRVLFTGRFDLYPVSTSSNIISSNTPLTIVANSFINNVTASNLWFKVILEDNIGGNFLPSSYIHNIKGFIIKNKPE